MASKLDQGLVALVKTALAAHVADWDGARANNRLFRDLYAGRFYGDTKAEPTTVRVETGDGPAHIESYLASLFSRSPAVEVGAPKRRQGDKRLAAAVVNPWLGRQREVFEQAVRLALLYPAAFLRVGPLAGEDLEPLDAVEVRAVAPWDVILDTAAPTWRHQRWIGHRYTLPLATARLRYAHVPAASWKPTTEQRYFETAGSKRRDAQGDVPDDLKLVTIIEFYDLVRRKLVIYSPSKDYGETAIKISDMPLRRPGTAGDRLHPLVPLYFASEPDAPLSGISTLSRIYDQLREKNLLRTNAAQCIRRDARQFVGRKDVFHPDDAQKLRLGQDGAILWVDSKEKRPLNDLIVPLTVPPMSSNFEKYAASIEGDIQKGSVLAAFTRGEATRATATEIGVLAEYSASAIGRMARVRDAAIELVAELYVAHLIAFGVEPVCRELAVGEVLVAVTRDTLDCDWAFSALDQGATPISKAIEQQRFLALVPVLQKLGVRADKILAQLVRLELLPLELGGADALAPPAADQVAPDVAGDVAGEAEPSIDELLRLATTGRSVAEAAPNNALPAA